MPRFLLRFDDLSDAEIVDVLDRAEELRNQRRTDDLAGTVVGLLFLSSSLRTRVGFATAALRSGGQVVVADELRGGGPMSTTESFDDTVRTLSGMVDLVVTRTTTRLDARSLQPSCIVPLVNAGDADHHPTQALVDLLALRSVGAPVSDLHVGVCGDLGMRSVRSLLDALERFPPARLTLMAPEGRSGSPTLGPRLTTVTSVHHELDVAGLDVLYVAGLPERPARPSTAATSPDHDGVLDAAARARFTLDEHHLARLRADAVVLSPLPVVDEITDDVRRDPRARMFTQSDDAVPVRRALLELLLVGSPS